MKSRPKLEVDPRTSRRMAGIRQSGTLPELLTRKIVHGLGHHYRVTNRDLPGSPDLANRSRRWVIFVHGCYWHRHEGCRRTTTPHRNREFWVSKFERNVKRDRATIAALAALSFHVLVVWECETSDEAMLTEKIKRFFGSEAF